VKYISVNKFQSHFQSLIWTESGTLSYKIALCNNCWVCMCIGALFLGWKLHICLLPTLSLMWC